MHISNKPNFVAESVDCTYDANICKNQGRAFELSIITSRTPAMLIQNITTTIRAIVITILWIKSDVLAARKPPIVQYVTITTALITIATK